MIDACAPVSELARILVGASLPDQTTIHSVDTLARSAGMSRRALQYRCQAVGVAARDCVRFVQCLNALIESSSESWDPAAMLPIVDSRTLARVLVNAGMANGFYPTVMDFVLGQRFISNASVRTAVLGELTARLVAIRPVS
jgi:hypothetical protein